MKLSVSFINSLYDEATTIKKIAASNADYLHVDIMDGLFVPTKNYSYEEIASWTKNLNKPLDIHLMVQEPLEVIKKYALLHPKYITFHLEATNNPLEIINYLKENNIGVGVSINPNTPINLIMPYLNMVDLILIMSVEPGAGGQKFMPSAIQKVSKLRSIQHNYHYLISIDGGINDTTIQDVNTDIVVIGSFICKSNDYNNQINKLHLLK